MLPFGKKTRPSRRKAGQQAWLVTDGSFALQACTVVDLSDDGAQIKVEQSDRLPKHFNLTFSRASRAGRRCEIRWKRGRSIGVKFLG